MNLNTLESACETCSLISRILPRFHLDIPEDIKKQNRELAFVWTFQLHKVVASARQGCHFCAFIAHRFFESNNLFTYGMQGRSYKLPSLDNEEARQTAFATALKKSNEFENDTLHSPSPHVIRRATLCRILTRWRLQCGKAKWTNPCLISTCLTVGLLPSKCMLRKVLDGRHLRPKAHKTQRLTICRRSCIQIPEHAPHQCESCL